MRKLTSPNRQLGMAAQHLLLLAVAAVTLLVIPKTTECSKIFSAYFPNWAHRRQPPFGFRPENIGDIVTRVDHLIYAYAHIDPFNYSVVLTEPVDDEFLRSLVSYKSKNQKLKVLISVGGDKFPSANFSAMAATYETRAAFITSLKRLMRNYGLDGVEINWQYPCSRAKAIHVEEWDACDTSCESYWVETLTDAGSRCPDDADNFLFLVQQLRATLGNGTLITLLGPRTKKLWRKLDLGGLSRNIDYWHVATYDFNTPALNESSFTAPNSPLHRPKDLSRTLSWNINQTSTVG